MRLYVILIALFAVICIHSQEPDSVKVSVGPVEVGVIEDVAPIDKVDENEVNRKRIAELENEITNLKNENVREKTENARKEGELVKNKSEVDRLNKEIVRQKDESAKLSAQHEAVKVDLAKEKAARLKTDEELAVEKASHGKNRAELAKERVEKERVSGEKKLLEQETLRLKTEMTGLESGHEREIISLGEENAVLRKELISALDELSATAEKLKKYERSAASIIETLSPVYVSVRESELAESLELVMSSGNRLAAKSADVCSVLLPKLKDFGMGDVAEAKLRLMLEELVALNGAFAKLTLENVPSGSFEKCRILEVNEPLGVVILSAGYRDGVRANMTLTLERNPAIQLKVVSVRPFVSAAVVVEGTLKGLVPGSTVSTSR